MDTLMIGPVGKDLHAALKNTSHARNDNGQIQLDPKLLRQREDAENLIKQLQSHSTDAEADRKEQARQKLERLKAQMMALRMMAAGDPKAAARQAARVARELAQAAREYAGAGGSNVSTVTASVPVSGAASGNEAKADASETATAVAASGDALKAPEVQFSTAPAATISEDDKMFASEARAIANELKRMLQRAREKGVDGQDQRHGRNALSEAEKSIGAIETGAVGFVTTKFDMPGGVDAIV